MPWPRNQAELGKQTFPRVSGGEFVRVAPGPFPGAGPAKAGTTVFFPSFSLNETLSTRP